MAYDPECIYCRKDKNLEEGLTEVCRLNQSIVYLLKDQAFYGRCVVAYKDHAIELFQLSETDRHQFFEEMTKVAKVIYDNLKPQKMNYAVFGDQIPHLHFHIVPRYPDGPLYGEHFCTKQVPPKKLSAGEFQNLKELLAKSILSA